ncbi:MAG: cytochrome c-type biogenesis protein, partial [Phaeobacter italicus]
MIRSLLRAAAVAALVLQPIAPAYAVQPDEVLADPALEARARELSKDLRCLVCRNESIDESNADLARDLRLLVRERLVAGDSNEEAMDFIVDRYGEYVLLSPRATGANWLLFEVPVSLTPGEYTLEVPDSFQSPFGVAIDGDSDGKAGG